LGVIDDGFTSMSAEPQPVTAVNFEHMLDKYQTTKLQLEKAQQRKREAKNQRVREAAERERRALLDRERQEAEARARELERERLRQREIERDRQRDRDRLPVSMSPHGWTEHEHGAGPSSREVDQWDSLQAMIQQVAERERQHEQALAGALVPADRPQLVNPFEARPARPPRVPAAATGQFEYMYVMTNARSMIRIARSPRS